MTGGHVSRQRRSARLASWSSALLVAVLALFAPSAAYAYGTPAGGPLTHHTVAAQAGKKSGPEDTHALRFAAAHRLDAHLPGPQPAGPPRTAVDKAPHRATGGPGQRPAAPRAQPHEAAESAAPRGPPHR
ncbi:hypothetical protein GKQ77_25055 [Streptomyces sp. BG9H]|uniref:Uncharacterized protein n=1 Tax=Streptomyces anatolicus TaxID=2675858 RepID=A0ABS6YTN2_9ACTN|nr:hypothetical protein [Streptomyces anatolicus]MBW5424795.1 hypothetical protein [Streptomyces anatolicus]